MGRMLGAFDGDNELDRPDLNKCPDCGCYFAQDTCPLCGKECPEEFRAGNRKPVKSSRWKKRDNGYRSGRVTFVEWYHSWWFILLMLILMPLVGIVLLATSPHKKSLKIGLILAGLIYGIVSTYGIGNIVQYVKNRMEEPVNTSLSAEEYIDRCEDVDPEDFFRNAESYKGDYLSMTLTVHGELVDYNGQTNGGKYTTYYLCVDADSGRQILVRDCRKGGGRLLAGDVITLYGEGAGMKDLFATNFQSYHLPCVNTAYVKIVE